MSGGKKVLFRLLGACVLLHQPGSLEITNARSGCQSPSLTASGVLGEIGSWHGFHFCFSKTPPSQRWLFKNPEAKSLLHRLNPNRWF